MNNKIIFYFCMFATTTALAAGGAAHGEDAIPFAKIGIQALNLGILVVALCFFLRKSIVETFAKRSADFKDQAEKTQKALLLAEAELKDVKQKISLLESTEKEYLDRANHDAEILKAKTITEAEAQAKRLKDDVALIISAELYKAKTEIKNEIIDASMAMAKQSLSAAATTISQKSEAGFISKLGQVKA